MITGRRAVPSRYLGGGGNGCGGRNGNREGAKDTKGRKEGWERTHRRGGGERFAETNLGSLSEAIIEEENRRMESGEIQFTAGLEAEMRRLCEAAYPEEACGFLLGIEEGGGWRIERAIGAVNEAAENRGHRYWAGKGQYEAAEAEACEAALEVVGVWHSHPDAPPVPSSVDAEYAFPGWVYWIVEVRGGKAGEARAWLRLETHEDWEEAGINDQG